MKKKNTLIKCIAAAAAVAGIAYLVVRYFDAIHAWLRKLCPCCSLEDDFVGDDFFDPAYGEAEHAHFAQQTAEKASTEEPPAEAAEAPETEEAADEAPKAPVAEESDFE